MSHADRLSAIDAAFLDAETPSSPLHVGAVAVFEGALDFARVREFIDAATARIPRYRQKIVRTPLIGSRVWVDDERFALDYHLRHEALPAPGDDRQLKRLAGRIFSDPLDRARPLWEMWFVEGLARGRFALITKAHHAMMDGVGGAGLLAEILRASPDAVVPFAIPPPPRPAPPPIELVTRELRHRAGALVGAVRSIRLARVSDVISGIAGFASRALVPGSPTPFNPAHIDRQRRLDWTRLELGDLKAVKKRLGGTVNDAALAIVAGALRASFLRRGVDPQALHRVRALVPVDVRGPSDGNLGNRVAMFLVTLPVDAVDPVTRFRRVHDAMTALKHGHQVDGVTVLEEVADVAGAAIVAPLFRIAARLRTFNITVTNVPGPPFPLYLLGARMIEVAPVVPLLEHQSIAIGLFSYAGGVDIGLTADWDQVRDLHDLVGDLETAYRELLAATAPAPSPALHLFN